MSVRWAGDSRPPALLEQPGPGLTAVLLVLLFTLAGVLSVTL